MEAIKLLLSSRRNIIAIIIIGILAVGLLAGLRLVQEQQNLKSRADLTRTGIEVVDNNGNVLTSTSSRDINIKLTYVPTPPPSGPTQIFHLPRDFSDSQGNNGWYYHYLRSGSTTQEARFMETQNTYWAGGPGWTCCTTPRETWMHVDRQRAVPGDNEKAYIFWKARGAGEARVRVNSEWIDNRGNGLSAGLGYSSAVGQLPDPATLQTAVIGGSSNPREQTFTTTKQMRGNDAIVYWLDSNGATHGDVVRYDIHIQFTPTR